MAGIAKIASKDLDEVNKINSAILIGLGTAAVGEVRTGETFYAGSTVLKTGTMPTVALAPGSSAYPTGYHVGDGGGLPAIDADLATANIKNGITIFNINGSVDVRDVSDANALVGEVKTGRTFYAVGGAIKTGTMPTVALAAGANAYPAGYHVGAASLTAVDGDLAAGNIADGITIFGVLGTFVGGALAEDILGFGAEPIVTGSGYYGDGHVIGAGGDWTPVATLNQVYAADSLAVGVGFANVRTNLANSMKLRLWMQGIQVVESAFYIQAHGNLHVLMFTKAMVGAQTCYISIHNYSGSGEAAFTGGGYAVGADVSANIVVGSIKL